jgi:uncharacterized membrane protein YfcA
MIRTLAGAAVGIAVAIILMMIVEAIGNSLFPPPAVDLNDPDAPAVLPLPNQLFPILGWFLASLIGGWLAIQVSMKPHTSWLVAASVVAGELLDYVLGRHAVWVMIVGILAPIVAAWLAQKLPRRTARVSA